MRIGSAEAPRTAQGLAIQGDAIHPTPGTTAPRRTYLVQPAAEQALELLHVDVTQQPMQRRLAWTVATEQAQAPQPSATGVVAPTGQGAL